MTDLVMLAGGFFLGVLITLGAMTLLLVVVALAGTLWANVGHSVAIAFVLVIIAGGTIGSAVLFL